MTEPVNIRKEDLGIIGGVHIWQVFNDDTGECIGWDQQTIDEVNE